VPSFWNPPGAPEKNPAFPRADCFILPGMWFVNGKVAKKLFFWVE
jgi:hypothetical protein